MASNPLESIADRACSEEHLISAIQQLGPAMESPQFWIAIADDASYSRSHRRLSIVQLFKRHVKPGMTLTELVQILGRPSWLRDQDIHVVEDLAGSIPVSLSDDNTVLVLTLLPDPAANTDRWQIYLSVAGKIDRADFWRMLQSQQVDQATWAARILEIGFSPSL